MSRVAVCLFFIAMFQNGVVKSLADETTTEGLSKNIEETTAKPTEDEPAKESEVPTKEDAEDKSGVTPKSERRVEEISDVPQDKDDNPNEGKVATVNESKKEDNTKKTVKGDNRKFVPDMLKEVSGGNGVDQTKTLFEFPKHILAPVNAVGAKVHEVVVKGLDTAKGLANGTFSFLRSTFNGPFQN